MVTLTLYAFASPIVVGIECEVEALGRVDRYEGHGVLLRGRVDEHPGQKSLGREELGLLPMVLVLVPPCS